MRSYNIVTDRFKNIIPVLGWVFNDQYLNYENEIARWTDIPVLGSVPYTANINTEFIAMQAKVLKEQLESLL